MTMRQHLMRGLLAAVVCLVCAGPVHAEIVYFSNGRTLSVKAHRAEGGSLVLTLRANRARFADVVSRTVRVRATGERSPSSTRVREVGA